jgi:hypothetical protein
VTPPPPICGVPLDYDPPTCHRPAGHAGPHETHAIPAPLTAVAARMVNESDALEREREHLAEIHAKYRCRLKWGTIALGFGLASIYAHYIAMMLVGRL